MIVVFICIGLSCVGSLLCLILPPIIPGIASAAVSVVAVFALALYLRKKRAREKNVVRVDGVTVDTRVGETETADSPVIEDLERRLKDEEKHNEQLLTDLDRANRETAARIAGVDKLKSAVAEIASSLEREVAESKLPVALSQIETSMRHSAGLREMVARQSEKLSANCDELKKRRAGEIMIEVSSATDEYQNLTLFASALEELYERSNVIAVNAAIEAARIGKEGKGFSVIAGEMQSLAAQAKDIADEIRVFGTSRSENFKRDGERLAHLQERERVLRESVDKAAAVTADLAEDVSRLLATGASEELEEVSKLAAKEIESRNAIISQLARLLRETE